MKINFDRFSNDVSIELNSDDVQRLADSETLQNAGISISFDLQARDTIVARAALEYSEELRQDNRMELDACEHEVVSLQEQVNALQRSSKAA